MASLRVRPHAPDAAGTVLEVTPASAGWKHVGFRVVKLAVPTRVQPADESSNPTYVPGRVQIS